MEVKDKSGTHKVMQLPTSPEWKAFVTFLKTFKPDTKPTTNKVNDLVELGLKMSKEEKLLAAKGTPHFNLRNYLYGTLNIHVIDALSIS
jgi:hypothetical protein